MAKQDEILEEILDLDRRLDAVEHQITGVAGDRPAWTWNTLLDKYGCPDDDPAMRASDHAAACVAGLAGGVLDLRPKLTSAMTNEELHQQLDASYKARVAEVAGDGTVAIDNVMGGPSHRMVGPTHDVLRLVKALQAVREGRFQSAVAGVSKVAESYRSGFPPYVKVESPWDAAVLVLMHWASDFFSKASLPLPGFTKLAEIPDREFVSALFRAYRGGANLRTAVSQFVSNLSGIALISVLLHLYRYVDMFWVSRTHEPGLGSLALRNDLRFRWMSRNANLIAFGLSTGKAAITSDIFSLNYVAFFKFWADGRAVERLLDSAHAELDARTDRLLAELSEGE